MREIASKLLLALALLLVITGAWWLVIDGVQNELFYQRKPTAAGESTRAAWVVAAGVAISICAAALQTSHWPRLLRRRRRGQCPHCGYDLAGLCPAEIDPFVCPECGRKPC
ncbi:MAG: hypothetical protein ACF8R7_03820 [Phycisphaerales bacterium JB039]